MSQVKGKNTKPELVVRKLLWSNGYRYRLHCKELPGKPDLVFQGKKKVIFVHGCFWHRHECKKFSLPKSNEAFWKEKIANNVNRDQQNQELLRSKGWEFLIVWECQIRKNCNNSELLNTMECFLD